MRADTLRKASNRLAFLLRCRSDCHLRPVELAGLSRLAALPPGPSSLPLSLAAAPPHGCLAGLLAGPRPGLPCILGSLEGILPAGSRGMQATRRPKEVVSLRRIVIPQFNHSCLRLHSQALGKALRGCSSAFELKLQYMTSLPVWFLVFIMVVLSHQLKETVSF